jgi:hypothetical protein
MSTDVKAFNYSFEVMDDHKGTAKGEPSVLRAIHCVPPWSN